MSQKTQISQMDFFSVLTKQYDALEAFSFLTFNLLCAPCLAAISAIRTEMHHIIWTFFAIGFQTILAYSISFMIYQFGKVFINGAKFSFLSFLACLLAISILVIILKKAKETYLIVSKNDLIQIGIKKK